MPPVELVHDVDDPSRLESYLHAPPIDFTGLGEPESTESLVADFSRGELDAKLALIEARMDARLARMEAVVEGMGRDASRIEATVQSGREENVNHRRWIFGVVIATSVAVIAAMFGAMQLLLGGLTAGLQSAMTSTSPPQVIYVQPPAVGTQPQSANGPQIEQRPPKERPPQ